MTKTFTHDDIIRYVYEETSDVENSQIEQAMSIDNDLLELYHEMMWLKAQMDGSMITPPKKISETVLKYSKALALQSVNN